MINYAIRSAMVTENFHSLVTPQRISISDLKTNCSVGRLKNASGITLDNWANQFVTRTVPYWISRRGWARMQ